MTDDKYERRSFQIFPVPFALCRLTFLRPEGGVATMAIIMQDLFTRLLEDGQEGARVSWAADGGAAGAGRTGLKYFTTRETIN